MLYRLTLNGVSGSETEDFYHSYDEALDYYHAYAVTHRGYNAWERVNLSLWNEGGSTWHTMHEYVADWHSSSVTHSHP